MDPLNPNFRGLIHSRWGGLGNHRYISGFGGDVVQTWDSLKYMIFFTSRATNVLFGYWGHEMMQLQDGDPHDPKVLELFTRVMQFGAYSPIYTNWGNDGCPDDLWSLPELYLNSTRFALVWRMQLLPYRYTLSRIAYETALSTLRPMYYAYPTEPDAYDPNTYGQYMMGDLLVVPAASPLNNITGLTTILVWFPPLPNRNPWVSIDDPTEVYPSDSWMFVWYPLSRVPVFVPGGTILPLLPESIAKKVGSATMFGYTDLEIALYPFFKYVFFFFFFC